MTLRAWPTTILLNLCRNRGARAGAGRRAPRSSPARRRARRARRRPARPPESGTLGLCLCDLSRPGGTMKIAVVGATGWIGGTVVREALARDHDVTAVVRDPSRLPAEHHPP